MREHAELKALSNTGKFKKLKEQNPDLILAVCGCMAQQETRANEIRNRYPFVDLVFGTNLISRFPELLREVKRAKLRPRDRRVFCVEDYETNPGTITEGLPVARESAFSAWVSIMYGCNNFCTYCIVPYVRGRERSRAFDAVVDEVRDLVDRGYKEITLLGQNVNAYGKTLAPKRSFAELLAALDTLDGDYILRFMTSHPKDMSRETIDVIANSKHIPHQIHLPLQSGSDEILKRMHRIYDASSYQALADAIRAAMPDCTLSTDIIIGFPGESEEDFRKTLQMISHVRYDNVFAFLYSPRGGTPAAGYPDQIPHKVMTERMERLLALCHTISLEKNASLVGKTLDSLVEGESKTDAQMLTARSKSGKLIHFPKTAQGVAAIGTFVPLTISAAHATTLIADAIDDGKDLSL